MGRPEFALTRISHFIVPPLIISHTMATEERRLRRRKSCSFDINQDPHLHLCLSLTATELGSPRRAVLPFASCVCMSMDNTKLILIMTEYRKCQIY